MKKIQLFASLLCIAAILLLTPRAALANSALKYWYGADAYGSVTANKDCPITVENELLTFDIPDFPQSYGKNENYSASVTARYTFYNPADYTVTARLEFPFGTSPHYATSGDDVNKYDITVNGSAIEKTVRHTLKEGRTGEVPRFNLEHDIAKITDGFKDDDFFTPELPVKKYVYEVGDYDENSHNAYVAFDFPASSRSRVFLDDMCDCFSLRDGYRLSRRVWSSSKTFSLYVFGEQLDAPPKWRFYSDRECTVKAEGTIGLISADKMTFGEFAKSIYPENDSPLETDWYNAVVDDLNLHSKQRGECIIDGARVFNTKMANLMRWYEYEITLAPGERIVNTVTAPIYPSIDEYMKPAVFKYTYLLSPAQSWADFGSLDIAVNTPFYLIDNSAFEKTETGYTAAFDGLPEGELEFTLSTGKNPRRDNFLGDAINVIVKGFSAGIIAFRVIIIAGVVVAVVAIVRAIRRKKH